VRPDSTPGTLAKLRAITPGGTAAAGNASRQDDAAAARLIVTEGPLGGLGLEPPGYPATRPAGQLGGRPRAGPKSGKPDALIITSASWAPP
jgi:hypothetical protein